MRMFLEFEIIPTIVVGVATIVVLLATIVVDCDSCENCDDCGHITSPHELVHCNCLGAIWLLFQPPAFRPNDVV